jgi:hypothetical protein
MIKQLIRSTSESNGHSVNYIQTELLGFNPVLLFQKKSFKTSNTFFMKSVAFLEELGDTIITEILSSTEESKLNKVYYDLIASEKAINLVYKFSSNPIVILQAKQVIRSLGVTTLGQLINEFKFPSTDTFCNHTRNIIKECSPLFDILSKRKNLTYGTSFRQNFFLVTNVLINETQFTTKFIRQCLFKVQTLLLILD